MSEFTEELTELGTVLDINGNHAICDFSLSSLVDLRQQGALTLARATSVGGYVKIGIGEHWLLGSIGELDTDRSDRKSVIATIDLLGEAARTSGGGLSRFEKGVTLFPHPGDKVYLTAKADLDQIFSPENQPHIEIGTVYPTSDVRASLFYDKMLSRHFAVVGSTGSGKSTLVSLMLHRIIATAPEGHIIVLDPHGEYSAAFASTGKVYNVDNLQVPYWVMTLQEHCEAFIPDTEESRDVDINVMAKCLLAARSKNELVRSESEITPDSPIPYSLADLIDSLDEEMGKLEKQAEVQTYLRLKLNILQSFSDRRYKFIFDEDYQHNSMIELLSDILRIPANGEPISIIDLSGAPSEIVKVIVSILSRLILDYAVWTPRSSRSPILLVCEEAQRYLPAIHPEKAMSAERQLERIAREGRKYGVSLGLITQRPSELSETALAQCGTFIALRLNNTHDQAKVEATLPEAARTLVDVIPALQSRECIICGEGARIPVRVRIDELEPNLRPASDDPLFSRLWNERREGNEQVVEVVRRWRGDSLSRD